MADSIQLIVTFDGLTVNALGPYGCSWLETPNLDQLGSKSIVFDRAVAGSVSANDVVKRMLEAADQRLPGSEECTRVLVTDCPETAELAQQYDFSQCLLVNDGDEGDFELADEIEATGLAQLFATALDTLSSVPPRPAVLWVHSRRLASIWDAPEALRESDDLQREDDEACETCVEFPAELTWEEADATTSDNTASPEQIDAARLAAQPPRIQFEATSDPDVLLAWMTAYGAQVLVVDAMLGLLISVLEAYEQESQTPVTLVMAGTSGFALGEHGWIGHAVGAPRSNLLHVPLFIYSASLSPCRVSTPVTTNAIIPAVQQQLARSGANVATTAEIDHLPETNGLLDLASPARWASPYNPMSPRVTVDTTAAADVDAVTVCPGWFYIRNSADDEFLFLKPDDRHDYNDVASLETDVVATLREK